MAPPAWCRQRSRLDAFHFRRSGATEQRHSSETVLIRKEFRAMSSQPAINITYWGITGTLSAPLRPEEVTAKLVHAVFHLVEQGLLANLIPGADGNLESVRHFVNEHLPFHLRSTYGGNTTCLEVETPDGLIILDCGSGCRELGINLEHRWNTPGYDGPRKGHVLITHSHMDHTYACAFVDAYFDPQNDFTIYGSDKVLKSLKAVFDPKSELSQIYVPLTIASLKAVNDFFQPLVPGNRWTIGSTRITTIDLNHPGGCLGFRLESAGRVFVFATDHEHPEVPDLKLAAFAKGADLLYMDGQYLQAEYEGKQGIMGDAPLARRGWGHSSVEACVATAVAAGARELHIGHREPKRNDDDLARIEQHAQELLRNTLIQAGKPADACRVRIPHEGLTVRLDARG